MFILEYGVCEPLDLGMMIRYTVKRYFLLTPLNIAFFTLQIFRITIAHNDCGVILPRVPMYSCCLRVAAIYLNVTVPSDLGH